MVLESGLLPVSTLDSGGLATLRLILDDVGSGQYFDGTEEARAHPDAYDPTVRSRLRAATEVALARQSSPRPTL